MPHLNPALDLVDESAFTRIDEGLRAMNGSDVVRLHQGKTYFSPCCSPCVWDRDRFPLLAHEHAPPAGVPELRDAIAVRLSARHERSVHPDNVVVAAGATHAIAAVLRCVLDPGGEVLVPSPQWLFATGLVNAAGGVAVEVPVFLELGADAGFDFVAALEERVTSRTRAIYFNSPNNPTGRSLDAEALTGLIGLAEHHDLWLIADNAYADFDFSPGGFVDAASLPGGPERTFSVYTFSKTYAMPGHRVGYVVVPPALSGRAVKSVLYSIYTVSTPSQYAALQALETPDEEMRERRLLVLEAWRTVHEMLEVPHTLVDGGLYTFLDLGGCTLAGDAFLHRCLEAGVSLAPGLAFGRHCSRHARLCFTATPPDRLAVAVKRINTVWGKTAA